MRRVAHSSGLSASAQEVNSTSRRIQAPSAASRSFVVAHWLERQHDERDECGDSWYQIEQANKDGVRVLGGHQRIQAEHAESCADQKEQRGAQQLLGHLRPHVRECWTTTHTTPGVAVTRDYTIAPAEDTPSRGTWQRRSLLSRRQVRAGMKLLRRVYAMCDT